MSAFESMDNVIRLPRVDALALSPDGSTAALGVSTLSADSTSYERAWWAVPTAGEGAPRRLTRSAKGEGPGAYLPSGDFLFVSRRAGADAQDDAPAQLWLLPAAGGEARQVTALAGGVSGIVAVASDAPVAVFSAPVLPRSASLEDDAARRAKRKDKKVSAILHSTYPVRYWDSDLGPDQEHLFVLDLGELGSEQAARDVPSAQEDKEDKEPKPYPAWLPRPRDLTPHPGRSLDHAAGSLSADGTVLVYSHTVPVRDDYRVSITAVDTASGAASVVLDQPGFDFEQPVLSADGTLAWLRTARSTPEGPSDAELWVGRLDFSAGASQAEASGTVNNVRRLAQEWDRWPASLAFVADGSALIVTADHDGRCPVFSVPLDGGEPRMLTADGAFASVCVDRAGSDLVAIRSSWIQTPHPVRISASGEVTALATPAPCPTVEASLTDVEATASDGARVRGWLMLPPGASAATPAPLLLWVHGGPLSSWNAWSWRWIPAVAAAQGYAVLLPDPALSTGYGLDFIARGWNAWGEAPFTDLMALADAVVARDDIDATRTAAMGGSFGGYMTNWIASHTDRFKAIVTHASLWALDQFAGTTDHSPYWRSIFTPEAQAANSPHAFVDQIVTPMLVIHGDKDYRVPVGESLRLWAELNERFAGEDGVSQHRFLYFPDENHWVLKPQHSVVWYQSVFAFLSEHVLGEVKDLPEVLG